MKKIDLKFTVEVDDRFLDGNYQDEMLLEALSVIRDYGEVKGTLEEKEDK